MKCPNCTGQSLRAVMTKQGVQVDYCGACKGVWLDEGELLLFTKKPEHIAHQLDQALKGSSPTTKLSPRSGQAMVEIQYPGGPRIDHCQQSRGLWFDGGELKSLLETELSVRLQVDRRQATAVTPAGTKTQAKVQQRQRQLRAGLLPLPNLFLRSTFMLTGLYALLGIILIAAVEFVGVDVNIAVGIGVVIIVLQFLIGPFLMDLSLRWLYRMDWVEPAGLPEHLRVFVASVCKKRGLKFPRFGIIDDGAPQAFTYGHTPGNARIVISRGLYELLEPQELEAVVAHEIGHAVHWDMFLMTIAQLVPLLLYYLYRTLIRVSNVSDKARYAVFVAVAAYVLYIIAEYVVLWFSRTREYHADRFAGYAIGQPSALASALVKIAYGLAGKGAPEEEETEGEGSRNPNLAAIGAMGIFDSGAALNLAVASYGTGAGAEDGQIDQETVKGAMRWDLWNPWAKWYELNSTHPLVANRLRYLSDQATKMGKEPYIVFDEEQPESYWDEFFVDLLVHLLPWITGILAGSLFMQRHMAGAELDGLVVLGWIMLAVGAAMFVRLQFSYRGGYFPRMNVAALLKRVKVSAVRPVRCTIKGTIIGRGVPGYIFSEDFVLRDNSGIIFIDYRQPLAIWEFLFGMLKAGGYEGCEVVVEGWYRRAPVPYIELKIITRDGDKTTSWVRSMHLITAIVFMVVGFFLGLGGV